MRRNVLSSIATLGGMLVLLLVCGVAPASSTTIYVNEATGWDGNDGLGWATAKRSVTAGLNTAEPGDEVWVAAGTYQENIILKSCVALYGGFLGNEGARSQRDWKVNVTILDGDQKDSVIVVPKGAPATTRVDGFTIRNGIGHLFYGRRYGGGVYCAWSSPTIANNVIRENSVGNASGGGDGGGVYTGEDCSPIIQGNEIIHNSAYNGGGVGTKSQVLVTRNWISENTAHNGAGVYINDATNGTMVSSNIISQNIADYGGGVCAFTTFAVVNNLIAENQATVGGGIQLEGSGIIIGNTIVRNIATNSSGDEGGGICWGTPETGILANNIVAFNSTGIYIQNGEKVSLRNNNVWGNTAYPYRNSSVTHPSDISQDPKFVSYEAGDYHLQLISPCINTGSNADVLPGWTDMDGEVRLLPDGEVVDIGADEYGTHAVYAPSSAKKVVADGEEIVVKPRDWKSMVSTANLDNPPMFYVEQSDRAIGLQCRGGSMLQLGQSALLLGTMSTIDSERVLTGAIVVAGSLSLSRIPDPLTVVNRSLGGGSFGLQAGITGASGLNNIGILVRTTGLVVPPVDADSFCLDDGSGTIVRVTGGTATEGSYVVVTGISSCEQDGEQITRLIRITGADDVTVVAQP